MEKIKIKTMKPLKLAYIEHIGEYSQVPYNTYVPKLFQWAKQNKIRPGFKNINVFYDDPEEKTPSECKSWIGIPIHGDAKSDDEIQIKDFPELQVATHKFKGPASKYKQAYEHIKEWMDEYGYEWDGPSFEVCSKKPKEVNGELLLYTTIQIPIKKK